MSLAQLGPPSTQSSPPVRRASLGRMLYDSIIDIEGSLARQRPADVLKDLSEKENVRGMSWIVPPSPENLRGRERRFQRCGHATAWLVLVIALLAVTPGRAAEGFVALRTPSPLAPNLAAMAQIAHPTSPAAEMGVNVAPMQLDVDVLKARAGCHGTPPEDPSRTRSVEGPMRDHGSCES